MKGLIFYLQRFTMTGTPSDDVLLNTLEGNEVLTYGGNDSITNMTDNASIYAGDGAGADSISNSNNYDVTILGGNDNDTIQNFFGSFISINGGKGNDNINNQFAINSTVNGDSGNDDIIRLS